MKPLLLLALLLCTLGCALKHHVFMTDEDFLNKLNYHGEFRATYRVGEARCFTNDARREFPQEDLKCY